MTDRELLEAAAKAAGLTIEYWAQDDYPVVRDGAANVGWNPILFDSDALRLAAKRRIYWYIGGLEIRCGDEHGTVSVIEPIGADECASLRRAIVRAAAAIGGDE